MGTTVKDRGIRDSSDAEASGAARRRVLNFVDADERRLEAGGISTAVLEAGEGPPIVLLHGPGEYGAKWMRVIPSLSADHRVIAPDLPAHGASDPPAERLGGERIVSWLDELVARTCKSRPVLVGHVLGGAIAARFAIERPDSLRRLVLVDSLGLAPFRPAPRFALTMLAFQMHPTERSYNRFMRQCSRDLDALREQMGRRWGPILDYNLELARSPGSKVVGQMMRDLGLPRIPPAQLARIAVPTTLIWGRQDRANRLRVAETASIRYGWSLHVIDDCADDPPRDQPAAFVDALLDATGT